jgi:hypothetical protein
MHPDEQFKFALERFMSLPMRQRRFVGTLVSTMAVVVLMSLLSGHGTAQQPNGPARQFAVQDECTFSDGAKIVFGQKAFADGSGMRVWRTGDYDATAFRITARTIIPPMDTPIDLAPGLDTTKSEPWTRIVSRKTPQPKMSYPGASYDVGRTRMGFSARAPADGFTYSLSALGTEQGSRNIHLG